ncbi:kinase-like protein [Bimuria novae-zelandiae CBS 107.79]|uniref:non-specific serine/threonine protein kinase n=1 Tax=Bimuria novae-zelandiae CBS 107.79 TaxID=1447943 RepID=A0A6A5VL92_9PLEO|nr:kinase-like protein [Bimuria novae-zelandiae CBS 107.79]
MDTLFVKPVERLSAFFDNDPEPRDAYDDVEIDEIAKLLDRLAHPSRKCPRIYIVLRTIGALDELEKLLQEGFHDICFPVECKGLPTFLKPSVKAKIVQAQKLILTKSLDLEHGDHKHFGRDDILPFEIGARLGSGTYGQVNKIESKISLREYALKRIKRRTAFGIGSREGVHMFKREIAIIKSLRHDHIIRYIGSYTDKTYLGLIMSLVADSDLTSFMTHVAHSVSTGLATRDDLSRTFQTRDQAIAHGKRSTLRIYFGCLAAAVTYLHDQSVRHKDIKPQNILIDGGTVLLTDFGLSRDFADDKGSTSSGPTAASPRYSPPEVAAYHSRNTSADVWSLGCVFFEMAAALQGYSIAWIKDHFDSRHTRSTHFHENPKATAELMEKWNKDWSERDRQPLQWTKEMLGLDRTSRPTAAQVLDEITAPNQAGGNMTFCGICCVPQELSDSSDLDSVAEYMDEPTSKDDRAEHLHRSPRPQIWESVALRATTSSPGTDMDDEFGLLDIDRAPSPNTESGICTPDTDSGLPELLSQISNLEKLSLTESPKDATEESSTLSKDNLSPSNTAVSGTNAGASLSHRAYTKADEEHDEPSCESPVCIHTSPKIAGAAQTGDDESPELELRNLLRKIMKEQKKIDKEMEEYKKLEEKTTDPEKWGHHWNACDPIQPRDGG